MLNAKILLGLSGAGLIMLSGCKSFDDYQEERIAYAVKHFERAQYSDIKPGQVLTLDECVRMAVKNNLDLKVFGLEEQVAKEMRTNEMLGMLPELNISNNLTGRNNRPASSSKQIHGDGPGTYSYSQSQDKTVNYLNVDLALSVLDFGLAFFNTQQSQDRLLELKLFPASLAEREVAFYRAHQNRYGLPLDSRADYTKLDWLLYCACLTGKDDDFQALLSPVIDFLKESPSRVPMTDWYDTGSEAQVGFQARSVVGGLFIRLLYDSETVASWRRGR